MATHIPPLTAKLIEAQQPRDVLYELTDPAARGLRLRVLPSGVKVFRWHVVVGGRQKVITIGRWSMTQKDGHVTLAEARLWLERLKEAHRQGTLTAVEAELAAATKPRRAAPAPIAPTSLTVRELAADFMVLMQRRRKRPEMMELLLRVHIVPIIGGKAVDAVTPRDCRHVVEAVVERGHRSQASAVLKALRQLFNFGIGRDDLRNNPAQHLDGIALGVERNVCQRFLSAEEIPLFWCALDAATPVMSLGLKVLLATGARSGELLKARWEHVDMSAATWTVPVANQKGTLRAAQTAKPWVVPLTSLALELLTELRALAGDSPWVMASPVDGRHPIADKVLSRVMVRLLEGEGALPAVLTLAAPRPTPHDIRRTVRTHLGMLRVPEHIAERCMNHAVGRIVATYTVYDYLEERREAMGKWDAYLRRLVAPGTTNVVPLVGRV